MTIKIDPAVEFYNGAENDYDLSKDPRCLFGWGGCRHPYGHFCSRELGHPGLCDDSTDCDPHPCMKHRRPKNWDTVGRIEANQ